jgi:type I restriction enzyme S subunit
MSFPRYARYRESGVEWLGEVPEHWETPPLYLRFEAVLGKMLDEKRITGEHSLPYVRNVDVQWDRINVDDLPELDITPDETDRFTLKSGDILICEGGEVGRTAVWSGALEKCAFQKAIHRLRPLSSNEDSRFFFYCMRFAAATEVFLAQGNPNTIPHLTGEKLRRYRFPTPSHSEQMAIAAFLDRETAKIDELVAEQRRLIELLKEKRQAVISHAVTKGLNPHAPMKPSGIEWLGDVPKHWHVKRLKHISPFMTVGIVVNPSTFVADEGLPFIYGGDIREGVIDWTNSRRISSESCEYHSKTRLNAGDLLVVRVGAPGVTAVVPKECDGGNCASVMLMRQGPFNSHWLCYAMNTRVVRFQVEVVQYGAAQEQFNISHAVNFWTPTPPRDEQDRIVEYLDQETRKLDMLSADAERAIDLLQERRTALISAAVTGKIDVRSTT